MGEVQEKIINSLKLVKREGIDDLINYMSNKTDFFTAPASAKYHSNYETGLAEHSWSVRELFADKNKQFKLGLSEDTVTICAIGHDLCKCNFYKKAIKNVKQGKKIGYGGKEVDNWVEKEIWEIDDQLPLSHGHKSVILLQRFIPLTEFEVIAIAWHMGLPEEYEMRKAYNKAIEKHSAIVALQTADFESSRLLEETIKD